MFASQEGICGKVGNKALENAICKRDVASVGRDAVVEVMDLRNPCVQLDQFQSGLMVAVALVPNKRSLTS